MNLIGADVSIHRMSSDDVPDGRRLTLARETYAHAISAIDLAPHADSPFGWRAAARKLPRLGITTLQCSAVRMSRQAGEGDDLILHVVIEGRLTVRVHDREIVARAGEAVATQIRDAATADCEAGSRLLDLRVPLDALPSARRGLDAVFATAIVAAEPLAMLLKYADGLLASQGLEQPESLKLAVAHVHEVVDLILARAGGARVERTRGPAAARLQAIKADIIERASSRELSIGAVAERHRVTARYVRKLFESESTTFTEFVLDQRLGRAGRMLTDPRHGHETISSIAFTCGFGDLSYFNRVFRRRHGATPSAVREAAKRGEEGGVGETNADDPIRSACASS